MNEDLKACPFCGCENVTLIFWDDDDDGDCTVDCHGVKCCNAFDYWGSQTDVIAKWNTRPIEDALRAEIESLRLQLDLERDYE